MRKESLSVNKTARIYKIGKWSSQSQNCWLCLHGYGFLAQYFIKHFEPLNNGKNLVIAPEALNRFYLEGTYGRVGASWMTKEERESDIEDIMHYLDRVYDTLNHEQKEALIAFGFSQGTPAIFRWVVNHRIPVKACVAWASDIPQDVLSTQGVEFLNSKKVYLVLGDQDEFVTPERLQQAKDQLETAGLKYEFISFEGKHRILEEPLLQLYQKIDQ